MKCLHIQLQPELCAGDAEHHVKDLTAFAIASAPDVVVNVECGNDGEPFLNVNINTSDIAALWASMSSRIVSNPSLASAAIVCCEGDIGWDDYLLLHHFDGNEILDTLS